MREKKIILKIFKIKSYKMDRIMKVSVSDSEYNQPSGLQEKLERLNHMMSAGGGEMEGTNYRRMQYLSSEYRYSV